MSSLRDAEEAGEDYDLSDYDEECHDLVNLRKPVNHLEDYDDMIQQLSLTTQKEVTLSRAMFKQLIQDDWSWKQAFIATSAMYARGK